MEMKDKSKSHTNATQKHAYLFGLLRGLGRQPEVGAEANRLTHGLRGEVRIELRKLAVGRKKEHNKYWHGL